jgi:hypothetical protein
MTVRWLIAVWVVVGFGQLAWADNCAKSRDYILNDLAGDLPQPAKAYQDLYQVCLQTLQLNNVHDAYVLRDGGIAVVANKDTLVATAETLSDFCRRFPRRTLRIISPQEKRKGLTPGLVALMSSADRTSCRQIIGQ